MLEEWNIYNQILITKFDSIAHFDCIFWPYGKYLHDKVAHVLKHLQPSEINLIKLMSFNLVLCKSELKFIYCYFDSISSPVIPPWIKLFESRLLSMFNEIKFGVKYWSLMRQNLFFGQYTKKNMCKLTIDIFLTYSNRSQMFLNSKFIHFRM